MNAVATTGPDVYRAMAAVMGDISKIGVSKDQINKQQGFKYRGVDDLMDALAPILAKYALLIVPRVIGRTVSERKSKSDSTLFHVVLNMEFDFIAASDGSKHTLPIIGEAMDSGDKATNKAMAIAYKYACFQAFCIPLKGSDPDEEAHEVKPNGHPTKSNLPEQPQGFADWKDTMAEVAKKGTAALQAAWKAADGGYRGYATTADEQWWQQMKAAARKVDATPRQTDASVVR